MEDDNIAIVRRWTHECMDQKHIAVVDEILA